MVSAVAQNSDKGSLKSAFMATRMPETASRAGEPTRKSSSATCVPSYLGAFWRRAARGPQRSAMMSAVGQNTEHQEGRSTPSSDAPNAAPGSPELRPACSFGKYPDIAAIENDRRRSGNDCAKIGVGDT